MEGKFNDQYKYTEGICTTQLLQPGFEGNSLLNGTNSTNWMSKRHSLRLSFNRPIRKLKRWIVVPFYSKRHGCCMNWFPAIRTSETCKI